MTQTNPADVNDTASIKSSVSDNPANVSEGDFLSYRLQQAKERAAAKAPPAPPPVEDDEEEPESDAELENEQETESDDPVEQGDAVEEDEVVNEVLSKIDLDSLTDEQLEAITQKLIDKGLSTRAVERFGKLTARAKTAEEQVQDLQRRIQELEAKKNPLEKEDKVENNPYNSIESMEELSERYKQFGEVETWARDILDENEDAGADDIIATVEGQELTKREVKKHLKNAVNARDKFLPARAKDIQKLELLKQQEQQYKEIAAQQLPWMKEDHSDVKVYYDSVMSDERVAELRKLAPPDVAAQLDFILAHFANSFYQASNQPAQKKAVAQQRPPSNPASNSTRGQEKHSDKLSKKIGSLKQSFNDTHNEQDLISLRTLQIANRYK